MHKKILLIAFILLPLTFPPKVNADCPFPPDDIGNCSGIGYEEFCPTNGMCCSTSDPNDCPASPAPPGSDSDFDVFAIPTPPGFKFSGSLGDVVSALLPYIFAFAGLASFAFIIWAGFEFLMSQGNPKHIESARNKLIQALVGFLIIFASYWIIQIIETIFDVSILK